MNVSEASEILMRARPLHAVAGAGRERLFSELKKMLQGRVEAAYVFGSILTNCFDDQSDLDLILVVETDRPFFTRVCDFLDIKDLEIPTDLLIYTPHEFEKLQDEGKSGAGFWVSVTNSMRRIV